MLIKNYCIRIRRYYISRLKNGNVFQILRNIKIYGCNSNQISYFFFCLRNCLSNVFSPSVSSVYFTFAPLPFSNPSLSPVYR